MRALPLPDELVRRHFLAPLTFRAGLLRFRKDHIASGLMSEMRERVLVEVVAAMTERSIPVLLFKGISYVGSLYPDPAERPMSDIDLLVPSAAFSDAAAVLRRLGYWRAGAPRQASRFHHSICFKRADAAVDLHRSVMQGWRSEIDLTGIWHRARPAAERDDGTLRMEPVDEAVLHLAHIGRHELRVPVINYLDAARLMDRLARPHEQILARARGFRIRRLVAAALAMSEALIDGRDLGSSLRAAGLTGIAPLRALLPDTREVLADLPLARPLQVLRKAILVDGPLELMGLLLVGAHGRLAHRFRA